MNGHRCARILEENWNRFGCPDRVVVVFELPSGALAAFCARHRHEGDRHAAVRGWKAVQPAQEAVA